MRNISALQAALAMKKKPVLVRTIRRSALPPGMTFLLEVAAGDADALDNACAMTAQSKEELRSACGFFIEQILLTNNDDSFRVLGAQSDTPAHQLRRHMALLLRWLHPDIAGREALNGQIDRSMFANRVTLAWETLKTEERRSAYLKEQAVLERLARRPSLKPGRTRKSRVAKGHRSKEVQNGQAGATRDRPERKKRKKVKILSIQALGDDSLFSRLVMLLRGRR